MYDNDYLAPILKNIERECELYKYFSRSLGTAMNELINPIKDIYVRQHAVDERIIKGAHGPTVNSGDRFTAIIRIVATFDEHYNIEFDSLKVRTQATDKRYMSHSDTEMVPTKYDKPKKFTNKFLATITKNLDNFKCKELMKTTGCNQFLAEVTVTLKKNLSVSLVTTNFMKKETFPVDNTRNNSNLFNFTSMTSTLSSLTYTANLYEQTITRHDLKESVLNLFAKMSFRYKECTVLKHTITTYLKGKPMSLQLLDSIYNLKVLHGIDVYNMDEDDYNLTKMIIVENMRK